MRKPYARVDKVLRVLRAVHESRQRGELPAISDVMAVTGIASSCTVHNAVALLRAAGLMRPAPKYAHRAMALTREGEETVARLSGYEGVTMQ